MARKRIVGNVLTAGSLGEDSLHHFAFSAFNTFDNALAPAHIVGNVANLYENLRDPNDWPDIVANTGGAHFGRQVFWRESDPLKPSASISVGRQELDRRRNQKEYKGAVVK